MIPLVLALVVGLAAFVAGRQWRAEEREGHTGPYSARRCAPPYNWADEGDL